MDIIIENGVVPADSTMPLTGTLYPGLPNLGKIKLADGFTSTPAGILNARAPDIRPGSQLWSAVMGTLTTVPASDTGYVSASASASISVLDPGVADQELYISCQYQNNLVGITCRVLNSTNYIYFVAGVTTMALIKIVAGVGTTLGSISGIPSNVGQTFGMKLKIVGNNFSCYRNDELIITATDSALAGNTRSGIYSAATLNRVYEFVASY